ncbi:MAG: hypothetical protein V3U78_02850 [Thiotrichaceae bacterium]
MKKNETLNFSIDLALPQETRLRFSGEYESIAAWRLLSRYISRYPHDLRVHAQRILLAIEDKLVEHLPGALQDLSIALSGKGKPFFTSLLEQAKSSLPEDTYQKFLDTFDAANPNQCWRKGSMLANGVCDGRPIVKFDGSEEKAGFADILEEARAYIEYGQIDEARELLEEELLTNPDSSDVEEELLYLYKSIRQRNHFETMTTKLLTQRQELGMELSPEWKQCQEEANSW